MNFASKLAASITTNDIYILFAAIVAAVVLIVVLYANKMVNREFALWKKEKYYSKHIYHCLTVGYTMFVTIISIFPLLGMFGTVTALLGLDLSATASESAKASFFNALTSTTWGIIFSVIFKVINALFASSVENNIQLITDLINSNREQISTEPPASQKRIPPRGGSARGTNRPTAGTANLPAEARPPVQNNQGGRVMK